MEGMQTALSHMKELAGHTVIIIMIIITLKVNNKNDHKTRTYLNTSVHLQPEQDHRDNYSHNPQDMLNLGDRCECSFHCLPDRDWSLNLGGDEQ